MQYMGGKVRIAKYLVPVLQERLKDKDTFVDLFCGSCNIISAIKAPNRIANESARIQRRTGILGAQGYKTGYPLAFNQEDRTVFSTSDVGVLPPNTYENFKHANCVGCLKAGKQHWYVVYCTRKDIWEKAKWAEDEIGYSIIKGTYLVELEEMFEKMKQSGVPTTEHIVHQTFWKIARSSVKEYEKQMEKEEQDNKPCECVLKL